MIVDASAMIEVLLGTTKAAAIARHLRAAVEGLDAPHLVDIEVAQVLRRLVLCRELDRTRAALALEAQAQWPLRRHAHAPLLPRVWHWRGNLSAYDAVYVTLAEALGAPLLTCDVRLGHGVGGAIAVTVV